MRASNFCADRRLAVAAVLQLPFAAWTGDGVRSGRQSRPEIGAGSARGDLTVPETGLSTMDG